MNLHAIVAPVIAAVNPPQTVVARINVGWTKDAAGTRTPKYATPGAFTGSIAGDVLTVTAVGVGLPQPGQTLAGVGITLPTVITSKIAAAGDGTGTYLLNRTYDTPIGSEGMATSMILVAQVQPLSGRDLRQVEGLNLGGELRKLYVSGDLNGTVRVELKGGDLITLPSGQVWLINQQLEGWSETAGWTSAVMTLQNGS